MLPDNMVESNGIVHGFSAGFSAGAADPPQTREENGDWIRIGRNDAPLPDCYPPIRLPSPLSKPAKPAMASGNRPKIGLA